MNDNAVLADAPIDPATAGMAAGASFQPSITWLNASGDTTITWDESDRAEVMEMVRRKMEEGYVFFIVKPVPLLPFVKRQRRIESVDELGGVRSVIQRNPQSQAIPKDMQQLLDSLNDAQLAELVNKGQARLSRRQGRIDNAAARRARTAEEAVAHQTLAVPRVSGG